MTNPPVYTMVPMPDPRGAYAAQVDILRAAVWRAMGEISNDGVDAAYETLAAAYALSERPNARDHEASGGSLTSPAAPTTHEHPVYPGHGWVEPHMDQDCPMLPLDECHRIAALPENEAIAAVEAALMT